VFAAGLAASARPVKAEKKYSPGVTDTDIKIGQCMPYSGNASAYGVAGRTQASYFRMINEQGGINGRKINFISLDDGYSPPKTVELTRQLVERDQVLLMFYSLGTQTNTAVQKFMNQKKVPQLFVATGASKWGNPKEFPWTMGWSPDYHTEGAIHARHILDAVAEPKIAILRQNDDMGNDYLDGIKEGLGAEGWKRVAVDVSFEGTDPTIDSQILQCRSSGANAFLNVTTPKFAAQAIKKAGEIGWKPRHHLMSVSASVGAVLRPAGFDNSQGIITAQYVKDVSDPHWADAPDYKEWKAFMDKWNPTVNPFEGSSVTGYASAVTLAHVLRQCGDELTRENVMRQAANLHKLEIPMLLPGITLNTSPTDYYPIQAVQLARFDDGHWVLFGNLQSRDVA
jgi:branched-chain amino acid transport system substrate-binding protein